jgi:hypothetical protein
MIGVVLATPVHLEINTDKDLYLVYQPGTLSVRFLPSMNFRIEVRVVGIKVQTKNKGDKKAVETRRPSETKHHSVKRKSRSVQAWRFLVERMARSVRIRELTVDIDTDDYALNAKLFPILYFSSRGSCSLNVNFSGRNYLAVGASVRPIALVWTYLLFLTKQ